MLQRRPGGLLATRLGAVLLVLCRPLTVDGYAKIKDKDALIALYEATNGQDWTLHADAPTDDETLLPGGNYQWDLESDPCPLNHTEAWHGVGCIDPCYYPIDGDDCRFGRIAGLQLGWNNLVGTIPTDVFDSLINLTIIDFAHNSLSGTIPTQVGKLRNIMCAANPASSPPVPPHPAPRPTDARSQA